MKHSTIVAHQFEASKFNWEIAPGKSVEAWGFNKQLPGPEIRAKVGDTVVVKLTNSLHEPTTIHWHGVRLEASMDGTDSVQKPIAPGETFEYRFQVPDAGTFWYHSHSNETVQMERGMYGSLIVEEEQEPVTDNERVLMIDDMKIDEAGRFTTPRGYIQRLVERHDGREGSTLLINGRENTIINVHAGQRERWRIINASSARYFMLDLDNRPFSIIGTDGGFIEQPQVVTSQLIAPGERLDIVVGPFEEGAEISMSALRYNRITFFKPKRQEFARVVVGAAKPSVTSIPAILRTIEPLASASAKANRKITLSVGPSLKNGLAFNMNGAEHVNDAPVRVGELQVWEVRNASLMDHPFHLHGYFFQVLEINGKAPAYHAWKDTVNLTPRTTVKIAWMPDNRPGMWMYHCHIIEHHAAGMMANFEVVRADQKIDTASMPRTHHHH